MAGTLPNSWHGLTGGGGEYRSHGVPLPVAHPGTMGLAPSFRLEWRDPAGGGGLNHLAAAGTCERR